MIDSLRDEKGDLTYFTLDYVKMVLIKNMRDYSLYNAYVKKLTGTNYY